MKYTQEELEIVNAIENNEAKEVPFDNKALQAMADETLEYLNEKKQISLNLKKIDLDFIKAKAKEIGIPYQSIIQALVHNYRENKIELKL